MAAGPRHPSLGPSSILLLGPDAPECSQEQNEAREAEAGPPHRGGNTTRILPASLTRPWHRHGKTVLHHPSTRMGMLGTSSPLEGILPSPLSPLRHAAASPLRHAAASTRSGGSCSPTAQPGIHRVLILSQSSSFPSSWLTRHAAAGARSDTGQPQHCHEPGPRLHSWLWKIGWKRFRVASGIFVSIPVHVPSPCLGWGQEKDTKSPPLPKSALVI